MENEFILPASNTLEQNAQLWADHFNETIKPGHGLFFDFSGTPELEKPCLDLLVQQYGWIMDEKNHFIRKQEAGLN